MKIGRAGTRYTCCVLFGIKLIIRSQTETEDARAVSYLVMSIKLDSLLPGTPTIPEQIANDKGPYYDPL